MMAVPSCNLQQTLLAVQHIHSTNLVAQGGPKGRKKLGLAYFSGFYRVIVYTFK